MDPVLAVCGLVPKREVGVLGSRPFGVFQKEAISTSIGQPGRTACTSSFTGRRLHSHLHARDCGDHSTEELRQ